MFNTANDCTRLIIAVKGKNLIQLSAKLEDHSTDPKTYWFILNRFLSNKKIPIIPAILVDDRVASNFAEKAEFFNSYFASQCTPVANKSQLPSFEFKMGKRIEKVNFTDDNINLIIKNLDGIKYLFYWLNFVVNP